MMRSIIAVRAVAGLLWLAQLTFGILFWTGHALALVQIHMLLGILFVVSLWALAALCARTGAPRGPVVALIALGAIIPVLGYVQVRLLPGSLHWMIRLVHLLLGLAAMPLAGRLSILAPRAIAPVRPPRPLEVAEPGPGVS